MELTVSLAAEGQLAEPGCPCPASVGFHSLGRKLIFQAERRYAELDGRRLVLRPELSRGLPTKGSTAMTFFGDWPASAWAQLREDDSWDSGRTQGALFRWDKDRWRRVKATATYEQYGPWYRGDGSIGAIVHTFDGGYSDESVITPLEPGSRGVVPKLARGAEGGQRLHVLASATLASGHLFVLGLDRKTLQQHTPAVERFDPGEGTGTLEALPLLPQSPPRLEWHSLAARSPADVYVAGVFSDPPEHFGPIVSYLVHWNGATWSLMDVPQGIWAPDVTVAEDGTLWMLNDTWKENPEPPRTFTSQLLRRTSSGEWAQVRLRAPSGVITPDVILSRVFIHGSAMWFMGFTEAQRDRVLVWTTAPIDATLTLPP
ncbi:hypothetical protein BE21_09535 [Sorangium cellulosum]|uniref:Uncharacterized protein n=1 Tax=Sorangium cellulosum TaxID=56 RepID=A0A150U1U9_SORCE|nr:hypothetical protein BE21_09535 [Sorangium cellulosum]